MLPNESQAKMKLGEMVTLSWHLHVPGTNTVFLYHEIVWDLVV
jgi:hypothetical protein